MKPDTTDAFIKRLERLDSSKTVREKFNDLCEMAYLSFAKPMAAADKAEIMEARYMQIVGTYRDKDTVRAYPELIGMAWRGVLEGQDYLGSVAGKLSALSAERGQFFTPYPVSRMMVEMMLGDAKALIERQGYITLSEPAAGAGSMVLAAADVLIAQGFDPAIHLLVHAVDISALPFWMCYLQLTWKGVAAYVERGNTLSGEHFDGAWTFHAEIFYEQHGHLFPKRSQPEQTDNLPPASQPERKPRQLRLFD